MRREQPTYSLVFLCKHGCWLAGWMDGCAAKCLCVDGRDDCNDHDINVISLTKGRPQMGRHIKYMSSQEPTIACLSKPKHPSTASVSLTIESLRQGSSVSLVALCSATCSRLQGCCCRIVHRHLVTQTNTRHTPPHTRQDMFVLPCPSAAVFFHSYVYGCGCLLTELCSSHLVCLSLCSLS